MTGLMYYRPEDHLSYIHECLSKIKSDGPDAVKWNLFIEKARKTPLPPIAGQNGRRTPGDHGSLNRGRSCFYNIKERLLHKSQRLPKIMQVIVRIP